MITRARLRSARGLFSNSHSLRSLSIQNLDDCGMLNKTHNDGNLDERFYPALIEPILNIRRRTQCSKSTCLSRSIRGRTASGDNDGDDCGSFFRWLTTIDRRSIEFDLSSRTPQVKLSFNHSGVSDRSNEFTRDFTWRSSPPITWSWSMNRAGLDKDVTVSLYVKEKRALAKRIIRP